MVKLNKIYTRTGDAGTTGLVDGSRVSKADARMQAIGDVDEANSAIGFAIVGLDDADLRIALSRIQNDLFDLGADLATPGEDFTPTEMTLRIVSAQVERLEAEIDAMNAGVPPLRSFILPGGAAAALHVAWSTPNMLMLESFAEFDVDWRDALVSGWNPLQSGQLALPDRPGLGIDLDEAAIAAHPYRALAFPSLWDTTWKDEFTGTASLASG